MLKRILLLSFVIANFSFVFAQGKSSIKLTFVDDKTKEPILDSVFLILSDSLHMSFVPDKDGNYAIKGLDANKYSIKVSSKGYLDKEVKKIVVYSDRNSFVHIPMVLVKQTIPKFAFRLEISFDSSRVFHEYTFSNYESDSLIFLGELDQEDYNNNLKKIKLSQNQIERLYDIIDNYMTNEPVVCDGIIKSSNFFQVYFGGFPIRKTVNFSDSVNFKKLNAIIDLMDTFVGEKYKFNSENKRLVFASPNKRFNLKNCAYIDREALDRDRKKIKGKRYSISKDEGKDTISFRTDDYIYKKYKAFNLDKDKVIDYFYKYLDEVELRNNKWNQSIPSAYNVITFGTYINSVGIELTLSELDYFSGIKEFNKILNKFNESLPSELKIDPKNIKVMLD